MGADNCVFTERKNKETGKWENIDLYRKTDDSFKLTSCFTNRDYELFALLAGVRGNVEPMVYPRGVPEDLSPEVQKIWDEGKDEFHSATWYDFVELSLREKAGEGKIPDYFSDDCDDENPPMRDALAPLVNAVDQILDMNWIFYPKPGEVRIVMWFDS